MRKSGNSYCWWKKSCQPVHMENLPLFTGFLGAGFLPSTVPEPPPVTPRFTPPTISLQPTNAQGTKVRSQFASPILRLCAWFVSLPPIKTHRIHGTGLFRYLHLDDLYDKCWQILPWPWILLDHQSETIKHPLEDEVFFFATSTSGGSTVPIGPKSFKALRIRRWTSNFAKASALSVAVDPLMVLVVVW